MTSTDRKIKQLRAEALAFAQAGEPRQALDRLAKLESIDPKEPDWPRRAAELHRSLGHAEETLKALARAAQAYVFAGMVVKAMAICKMMLAIDPHHPAALQWIAGLDKPRGLAGAPAPPRQRLPLVTTQAASSPAAPPVSRPAATLAQKLAAERGLVAVARAVGRKPRPAPQQKYGPVIVARAQPPPVVKSPPSPPPPAGPAPGATQLEQRSEPRRISLPPLANDGNLHKLLPSHSMLGSQGAPSGMFRLAIDEAEESVRSERTLRQVREVLPAMPLFSEIDPTSLAGLVRQSRLMHVGAGDVVVRQGELLECLYVVVNGTVELIDDAASQLVLYRLGENEFFGESALISNEPQPATIRATEATDLIAFDREVMRACIANNPSVVAVLLRFLRERMIEQLLRTSPLFAGLDTQQRRALCRRFEFIELAEGAVLIQQGARPPGLFVLLSGVVDATYSDAGRKRWLACFERGGVFGELLAQGSLATAEVRCASAGFALMLPSSDFQEVTSSYPQLLDALEGISVERHRAGQRRALSHE